MASWFKRGSKVDLDKLVDSFELARFPGTTVRTLQLLRDPDSESEQLAAELSQDPGLTVRLLRLVNSAGMGLRHPVDDLSHAANILGRSTLESMLISAAVRENLPAAPADGFDTAAFWAASARRATSARAFGTLIEGAANPWLFTAALLQDMAVPMLAAGFGERYAEVLASWQQGEGPLHELERAALGCDHAELAVRMCQHWELPPDLTLSIGAHHGGGDGPEAPAPLRLSALIGAGEDEADADAVIAAAAEYGLDAETVRGLLEQSYEEAREVASLLA